ncbi:MAG: hypothetical protein WD226_08490 [Planctomycetota bacterium]
MFFAVNDRAPRRARRLGRSLVALLCLGSLVLAQGSKARAAGERALAAGEFRTAVQHLTLALALEPSEEVAQLLVEASESDADAHWLWAEHTVRLASDAAGRVRLGGAAKRALGRDRGPGQLASARAAAVRELVSFASRRQKRAGRAPAEGLVAAWARSVARDVARGVPALETVLDEEPPPRVVVEDNVHEPVLNALESALSAALAGSRAGDAVDLARALHGFAVQAAFEDLQGERPAGMERRRTTAATALRKARGMLAKQAREPWTVDDLEWLDQETGEAFTRRHATFGEPARAISPNGLYTIETDCGYETLLGVARTIELHHQRLAGLFGEDPFVGRPGLVRIVPEAWGLEAEGAPFWWAGGFQGGDTTTVRFSCGTIEALGHTLTHELTHRFDGALFQGQPSWLVEGKAVWTGAAYGSADDEVFALDHAIFGTVEAAFVAGFGNEAKLADLIRGEPEDYRDNYVAGYALYLYLHTWEKDGVRLFAEALDAFQRAGRPSGDALEHFSAHFADGVAGRPADFPEFAARFGDFLAGFYWRNPAPWTERYRRELERAQDDFVLDEPTWVWSRRRAEPYFGSALARQAGVLLQRIDARGDAALAYAWALAVDGRDPSIEAALLPLFAELREDDAAWVVERMLAGPFGSVQTPAPFWNKLSKTRAYVETLKSVQADLAERGLAFAAEVLRADRRRVEDRAGIPADDDAPYAGGEREERLHPFEEPPRLVEGWVEEGLTDFEKHRVPGLWAATDSGDLIVGRAEARTGTGRFDRRAYDRHAFARNQRWVSAGRYKLRGRVRFTTAFATGALVVGYARRDQNVRVHFRGGDYLYSIGESEDEPKFEEIRWRFDGLRERDGPLGAAEAGVHAFPTPSPTFEFELIVDGSNVEAWFDGRHVGTYHTVDGAPIEGFVGFATSYGAIEVQAPTIERLDRGRRVGAPWTPTGHGSLAARGVPFEHLEHRRFHGLPASPNGTVLVWAPMPWRGEDPAFDAERVAASAADAARLVTRVVSRRNAPQPILVAAPRELGPEALAGLAAKLAELVPEPRLVLHEGTGFTPPGLEDSPDAGKRWVLFVDPFGVVRVASPLFAGPFQGELDLWLDVFRDVGRPERALPPITRRSDEDDGDVGGEGVGEPPK